MSYKEYKCRKCQTDFHYQVPRGFFLKTVVGFLPIRIYWCPRCTKNRYVWVKDKSLLLSFIYLNPLIYSCCF